MHPLSGPLQPGLRFFRDPLPTTDARQFTPPLVAPCGATPLWAYPVPCGEHGPGGPRLSAGDRHVSVPPPSREATGHVPFWFEPVSRFGSFKLDGIYQRFTDVGPLAQPCASSGFRLPESHGKPHGRHAPRKGRLRCRCARHEVVTNPALHLGYGRLNARLQAGLRLSNNSSHGLRRAHNPTSVSRGFRPFGRLRSGFHLTMWPRRTTTRGLLFHT